MIGVNIGVPVPREPFSFGGILQSKFGDCSDITGEGGINFWTQRHGDGIGSISRRFMAFAGPLGPEIG